MPEPLRLLHLFSGSAAGGTERSCLNAVRLMDHERFVHSVAFVDGTGPMVEAYRAVADTCQALDGLGPPGMLASLIRLARVAEPKVVIAYGLKANFLWRAAWLSSPRFREPAYVMALRSTRTMETHSVVLEWIDRATMPCADLVFSNSHGALASLRADGYPVRLTAVAYNGVDTELFAPPVDRAAAKAALGLPVDRPIVACVANLRPLKRHAVLLRAFVALLREHPRALLVLAGRDHLDGQVQRLASDLGITESVRFLGQRRDPQVIFKGADVCVLTSEREGMPGALLEAMATEVPVVATRVGGVAELVEHEVTGILVRSGDAEGVTRALGRYLADPELAARSGARGRQRVREHFSMGAMKAQWEAAADLAVEARKGRPFRPKLISGTAA